MSRELLEPEALQAILDVVDANPATLWLLLPRDTESVAEILADAGGPRARRAAELARSASMLLVVTAPDDRVSLLQADEVLETLLQTIAASGLQYSAMEVGKSRDRLRRLAGSAYPPQILLLIGPPAPAPRPAPRRPVETVCPPLRGLASW